MDNNVDSHNNADNNVDSHCNADNNFDSHNNVDNNADSNNNVDNNVDSHNNVDNNDSYNNVDNNVDSHNNADNNFDCHNNVDNNVESHFQIGAGLYAVGRPVQKRNDEDGQIGTIQSLPLERGALFNRFFGEPAHGPPHVAGGASGPIGGCRDESRTDNPDLDLRHVFDRNNRKTDLI